MSHNHNIDSVHTALLRSWYSLCNWRRKQSIYSARYDTDPLPDELFTFLVLPWQAFSDSSGRATGKKQELLDSASYPELFCTVVAHLCQAWSLTNEHAALCMLVAIHTMYQYLPVVHIGTVQAPVCVFK
jgi:hypothetical protein